MKLVDIIRFFKGYVRFSATGGFTERFINLCSVHGIRIWNLEPELNRICACVTATNFFRLKAAAKNSGVKIKIIYKKGLPFIIKKHRSRIILPIGAIFFIIFAFIMNQFVWVIEVTGTEELNKEQIIQIAEDYGLYQGAFVPSLDESAISRSCINHFKDKIVWMAVNIKGSKAVIEVRDFKDERKDTTYGDPCNIVADFDGKILSIEAYNGDREVTAGNGVKAGDLLISGVFENRDMSCDYLEARGKITALHSVEFTRSYNKALDSAVKTQVINQNSRLKFLWAEIPLYIPKNESYTSYSFSEYITCNRTKLPFGSEKSIKVNEISVAQAKTDFLYALDNYIADFYFKFRNTNILDVNFSVLNENNKYIIRAQSECIDFMGEKKLIYSTE